MTGEDASEANVQSIFLGDGLIHYEAFQRILRLDEYGVSQYLTPFEQDVGLNLRHTIELGASGLYCFSSVLPTGIPQKLVGAKRYIIIVAKQRFNLQI